MENPPFMIFDIYRLIDHFLLNHGLSEYRFVSLPKSQVPKKKIDCSSPRGRISEERPEAKSTGAVHRIGSWAAVFIEFQPQKGG
jgi:hypothetical protein